MAGAKASTDRVVSANQIVERGDIIEFASEPGLFVVVDVAGSGKAHVTSVASCDCKDFIYRCEKNGGTCKHIIALRKHLNIEACPMCANLIEGCVYPAADGQDRLYYDFCEGNGEHVCKIVRGL